MTSADSPVAVITGASSGIGKQVALALAEKGWRVIGTGRSPDRIAQAQDEIRAVSQTGEVEMIRADLSLLAEAMELADRIKALTARVDLLALLRTAAKVSEPGRVRIINTASDASEMIPSINLDDMQNLQNFSPGLAYCTGKLANVLFARALASRLGDDGIAVHAVHPGAVDSNFFSYAPDDTQERARELDKVSEQEGADTLIWLATEEEGGLTSGGYWFRREARAPNPVVEDAAAVDRFWRESEKLVNKVLGA